MKTNDIVKILNLLKKNAKEKNKAYEEFKQRVREKYAEDVWFESMLNGEEHIEYLELKIAKTDAQKLLDDFLDENWRGD